MYPGYPVTGYPAAGYQVTGYPVTGYPAAGYPAAGYQVAGYPAAGYPVTTYPATGYQVAPVPNYGYAAATYGASVGFGVPATNVAPPPIQLPVQNWEIQFRGSHLDRKDLLSKSDPFFMISASTNLTKHFSLIGQTYSNMSTFRKNRYGTKAGNRRGWTVIYKSEYVKNNQSPTWKPFIIDINKLTYGNLDNPILIEVYDYDSTTNHDLIGKCVTSVKQLQVMKEIALKNKYRIGITNVAGRLEVVNLNPIATVVPAGTAVPVVTPAPQTYPQQGYPGQPY